MAEYSDYLGTAVTVQYRLGDIVLSATGFFVGDSGRSIFLEQHVERSGRQNYFRWEIPYGNIHTIEKKAQSDAVSDAHGDQVPAEPAQRATAAAAAAGALSILPRSQPPKGR